MQVLPVITDSENCGDRPAAADIQVHILLVSSLIVHHPSTFTRQQPLSVQLPSRTVQSWSVSQLVMQLAGQLRVHFHSQIRPVSQSEPTQCPLAQLQYIYLCSLVILIIQDSTFIV